MCVATASSSSSISIRCPHNPSRNDRDNCCSTALPAPYTRVMFTLGRRHPAIRRHAHVRSDRDGIGACRKAWTRCVDRACSEKLKRKAHIKAVLLNQNVFSGIGNIYADEALFRAGIKPTARNISRPRAQKLLAAVDEVLREAIEYRGSSVSDYVDTEGRRGSFQQRHRVYARENLPCVICGTPIRKIVVAGRGTHYCPKCQR